MKDTKKWYLKISWTWIKIYGGWTIIDINAWGMIERSRIHLKKQRATPNFTASATEIQCNPHTSALRIIIILGSLKWGAERIFHSNRREDCSITGRFEDRISNMETTILCGNERGQWATKEYDDVDKNITLACFSNSITPWILVTQNSEVCES